MKYLSFIAIGAALLLGSGASQAQSKLYPQLFDLQEVTLLESPWLDAQNLNYETLMQYDVDRLLTPFMRQAGFTEWEKTHPNFSNWGSGNFRLDGHVGGHYLTALSLSYASVKDEAKRSLLKERIDYMVDQMDKCQKVFDDNTEGLCGYIGGLPDNTVWTRLYKGDLGGYDRNRGNVPLYTMHKVYAGLRDAWLYAGSEKARACFLKLCDWGINLISNLTSAQIQSVLDTEPGGINEPYADAYAMTGDDKYLKAALAYSHQTMIDNMQTVNTGFLDNKHANTQVPKYIGFQRIAQVSPDSGKAPGLRKAASNFWTDVVANRTLATGGNSVNEHFLAARNAYKYIDECDGPETCNTNNMLKLTEDLFADSHSAKLADFYEKAMLNHILATQNPTTGGYVYFTSLRPQHYHVYSQVNQGMWCCVGTGMENHSKYGEFVYSRSESRDTLYVNLFVNSKLENDKFAVTQSTSYPYSDKSVITVDKAGSYTIAVRKPGWCAEGYSLKVNGTAVEIPSGAACFVPVTRTWNAGDKIEVEMPMSIRVEPCPGYDSYVAISYGPVLLGAKTGTDDLALQFAGEGRMDHSPGQGVKYSLTSAPMLIGERAELPSRITLADPEKLIFRIDKDFYNQEKFADLELQPFYTIHESRYMVYWNQLTQSEWDKIKDQVMAEEDAKQRLNERTVDFVATGEQQSDAGHVLYVSYEPIEKGTYNGEYYINAKAGQYFSYVLETKGLTADDRPSLMVRYNAGDKGRQFKIEVRDVVIFDGELPSRNSSGFYDFEYELPKECFEGNPETITVKFTANGSTYTPGIYYIRLLRDYEETPEYSFVSTQWVAGDANRVNSVSHDVNGNTVTVSGRPGANNICLQYSTVYDDYCYLTPDRKYFTVCGSDLSLDKGSAYLWWLGGVNRGTQVAPAATYRLSDGRMLFVWDISKSGLDDNLKSDYNLFSSNGNGINTCFGITSVNPGWESVISDVNFYTREALVKEYPETEDLHVSAVEMSEMEDSVYYDMNGMKVTPGEYRGVCVKVNASGVSSSSTKIMK